MISIRLFGEEIVGIVDDNTPVPHTLARITEESTDYGLADEARIMYPELVKKKTGEGAAFNMDEMAGAVGGAYKEKETDEDIIVNIGDYVESVVSDDESDLAPTAAVSNANVAPLAASSSVYKKAIRGAVGGAGGGGVKQNGYCMFIKHIARKNHVNGSISELMAKFDKDWKMLSGDEKAEWKLRAKSGGNGRRPGASQERGRGPSNAPVAPPPPREVAPLAPRGRGRGRGRGIPVKVASYDDEDYDDYY